MTTFNRRSLRYRVVDVFTQAPLEGNPLAVFPEARGLDTEAMQRIAKELNLSETVFFEDPGSPECVKRLRIFTPLRELSFAGHPTVGSSYVLLEEGWVRSGAEQFYVEEKIGPVPVRVEGGDPPMLWLETPPIAFQKVFPREACAAALHLDARDLLNIDPQIVTAGNPALFVAAANKAVVDRAYADTNRLEDLNRAESSPFFIFVFAPTPQGAYSRMFAPNFGIIEDPATGSATGPLAAYMKHHHLLPENGARRFLSEQGAKMQRRSLLYFELPETDGAPISVGGHVTPVITAVLTL